MCKHTHINRQCKFVNCRRCKLERSLFIRRNIFRGNFAISFLISFRHTAEYIPVRKYSRANLRVTTMFVSENSLILPSLCATCRNGWLLFLSLRIFSPSLPIHPLIHYVLVLACRVFVAFCTALCKLWQFPHLFRAPSKNQTELTRNAKEWMWIAGTECICKNRISLPMIGKRLGCKATVSGREWECVWGIERAQCSSHPINIEPLWRYGRVFPLSLYIPSISRAGSVIQGNINIVNKCRNDCKWRRQRQRCRKLMSRGM